MKTLHEEQMKKITSQRDFNHSHTWRSPFGPCMAFKVAPYNYVGRAFTFDNQQLALLNEAALLGYMCTWIQTQLKLNTQLTHVFHCAVGRPDSQN